MLSDAEVFSFESLSAAARLRAPLLMVHSDGCAQPAAARWHFAVVPGSEKALIWEGATDHFQYYDDPAVIDRAAVSIADWLSRHLDPERFRRDRNVESVRRFYALLEQKDIGTWAALWRDDARIVTPYAVEGFATVTGGRAAISAGFRELFANFARWHSDGLAIHPIADADAVIAEYDVDALLIGGQRYENTNIAVFRFRDGLIAEYRDYFDPRRFHTVVDTVRSVPA